MKKSQKISLAYLNKHRGAFVSFFIMFAYGLMLLMVGYTSYQISQQLFGNNHNHSVRLQLLTALPQAFGLLVGAFGLKPLMPRVNIRTIMVAGMALALPAIVTISQLDKFTGTTGKYVNWKAVGAYIPLNFLFGLGISICSPVTSTYLGTVYTGKTRSYLVSGINGLYGLGAGFIPLFLTDFVYGKSNGTPDFDAIRPFFYISLVFCILTLLLSLLLDYRFTPESLSVGAEKTSVTTDNSSHQQSKLNSTLLITFGCIFLFFCFYLIFETGANYGLAGKYINQSGLEPEVKKENTIHMIRGLGLFFLLQGIWRAVSPLIFKKVRYRFFILFSAVFVFAGYLILAVDGLSHNVKLIYLVAILLAIGIGNMWPIIFSFVQSSYEEKRSILGLACHICTAISIILSIIIANFMLAAEYNDAAKQVFCWLSALLGFAIFGLMTFLYQFLKKQGIENSDEMYVTRKKETVLSREPANT